MNYTTPRIKQITSIAAILLVAFGINIVYTNAASTWKPAPANPPSNNVQPPVNVSNVSQAKDGVLGVGGLAVFGSSVFTGIGTFSKDTTYTAPAGKTNFLLGVNGAVGAAEYCDQFGTNCVTTLGGPGVNTVTSNASSVSSGGQYISGWPNVIMCNATTGRKYMLPLVGYFPKGQERYSSQPGYIYGQIGGLISIFFDASTKKSLIVHGNGDYMSGGQIPKEYAPCFDIGKSINDPAFTKF